MAELKSPTFSLTFKELGTTAAVRGDKGTVAIIVRDAAELAPAVLAQASQIPSALGKEVQAYIARAFLGYVAPPQKVVIYVLPEDGDITAALAYMETVELDYLAGPMDCSEADAKAIADWVKAQRETNYSKAKAVLPNYTGDDPGIINFTSAKLTAGETEYTAAEYCARIAGLIAGTPMAISATYAPLPELTDCDRMTKAQRDEAVAAGKLFAFWDGRKAKLCRAVNSLTTTSEEKGILDSFKKIKIVEVQDMIRTDVHRTVEDEFIGKYSNTYDNRMLLVAALRGYFEELRVAGLVQEGYSVDLDVDAIEKYLAEAKKDTSSMSVQELRRADTGTHVFLTISCRILDAIEDVTIAIEI